MHRVKLRKVGKDVGLTIPVEVLARLEVVVGDTLILTDTPNGFRLTRQDKDFEDAMEAAARGMRKYRKALRDLAD